MKLLTLFVVVLCFHANAASYAQNISLKVKDASLENVLKAIRKQSGYGLVYTTPLFKDAKPVSLNVKNTPLEDALQLCFQDQPFTFILKDNTIIVSPKEDAPATPEITPLPPIPIKGRILDDKHEPLAGATITLKGTQIATSTDDKGNFTITVPTNNITLVISYQGFATQEVKINNRKTLEITLRPSASALSQVVVLGYTTVLKKDLTGAVSSLTPEQITRVQSNNPVQSLVGVAGVRVSGGNDAANIRVRGSRSVNANNTPTIVVDGMPYYGSFNTIDQNDIASIDILKDASSTALYGSRGANGVIVVTTKKGTKGKAAILFDSWNGVGAHYYGNLHPMNAAQYIQFKRDANQGAGIWNSPADDPKIFTALEMAGFGKVDNHSIEDYYKKLSFQSDNTVTIVNGGEKGTQKLSFNFYNNNGRATNTDNYDRYILSINIDHQALKHLKVGVSGRLSYEFQQALQGNYALNLFRYPPTVNFYDSTGKILTTPIGDPNMRNPNLDLDKNYFDSQSRAWQAFLKGFATYDLTKNLSLTTNLSMDQVFTWAGLYQDNRSASYNFSTNMAQLNQNRVARFAWNNVLSYKKKFGKHSLDATGVFELQGIHTNNSLESGQDLSLAQYKWYNIGSSLSNQVISSSFARSQLLSYLGRIQYAFEDKYLLTLTAREDGASQLSSQDRWQLFPSAAAAWRISEESFLKNNKYVNELKLRGSYGVTGNDAIGAYATQGTVLSRYTIFAGASGDVPYATMEPDQAPVADLKWERTNMLNIGLDFGLFNNRITGAINYYDSRTFDVLYKRLLPYTTGFNFIWDNIGKTRNHGYELELSAKVIDSKDFRWNVNMSFYHNKEQLTELYDPRLTQDIQNKWFLGYPVSGVIFDYSAAGIWQTNEAKTAAIYGRTPGEIKVRDLNGDSKIDGSDRKIIGSDRPTMQSSMTSTFSYKQFDVAVDIYSELGAVASDGWIGSQSYGSVGRYNAPLINYWTPTNPSNTAPQPRAGSTPAYLSAIGYHSNDFVRLRNVTLGYTFSKRMIPGLNRLRLYASATNPTQYWSFTREGGLSDKEVIYNLGLNISL